MGSDDADAAAARGSAGVGTGNINGKGKARAVDGTVKSNGTSSSSGSVASASGSKANGEASHSGSSWPTISGSGMLSDLAQTLGSAMGGKAGGSGAGAGAGYAAAGVARAGGALDVLSGSALGHGAGSSASANRTGPAHAVFRQHQPLRAGELQGAGAGDYSAFAQGAASSSAFPLYDSGTTGAAQAELRPPPPASSQSSSAARPAALAPPGIYSSAAALDGALHAAVRAAYGVGSGSGGALQAKGAHDPGGQAQDADSLADEFLRRAALVEHDSGANAHGAQLEDAWAQHAGVGSSSGSRAAAAPLADSARPAAQAPPQDFMALLEQDEALAEPDRPGAVPGAMAAPAALPFDAQATALQAPAPLAGPSAFFRQHVMPGVAAGPASGPPAGMSAEQWALHLSLDAAQTRAADAADLKSGADAARIAERIAPPDDGDPARGTGAYAPTPERALAGILGTGDGEAAHAHAHAQALAPATSDEVARLQSYLPPGVRYTQSYVDDVYGLPPLLAQAVRDAAPARETEAQAESQDTRDRRAVAVARLSALRRHLEGGAAAPQRQPKTVNVWELESWMRAHIDDRV